MKHLIWLPCAEHCSAGLSSGLWTLENLDQEAPTSAYNRRVWARHPMNKRIQNQTTRQPIEDSR